MAYDSKCLDLAQYFLGCEGDDGDATQADLAQRIQNSVEDWFAEREATGGEGDGQTAKRHCDDEGYRQAEPRASQVQP